MAFRQQNVLITVVEFLGMGQDTDKPSKYFAARLKGQALVCDFTKNYLQKMVMDQLMRGLVDPTIQEKVLAHTAINPNMTLNEVQVFIESKKSSKRDQITLSHPATLNGVPK